MGAVCCTNNTAVSHSRATPTETDDVESQTTVKVKGPMSVMDISTSRQTMAQTNDQANSRVPNNFDGSMLSMEYMRQSGGYTSMNSMQILRAYGNGALQSQRLQAQVCTPQSKEDIQKFYMWKRQRLIQQLQDLDAQEVSDLQAFDEQEGEAMDFISCGSEQLSKVGIQSESQIEEDEGELEFQSVGLCESGHLSDSDIDLQVIQPPKLPELTVDNKLINDREKAMNIDFTALGLKRLCDMYVDELSQRDLCGYTLQTDNGKVKVWTRSRGIDECPDIPIARSDHFFPDVDDPKLLLAALMDFRKEWDGSHYSLLETLDGYGKQNVSVQRQVTIGRLGTSGREFVDKKIYFSVAQAVQNLEGKELKKELKNHSTDEYYMYLSSVPESLIKSATSSVRADTILCFYIIGKHENLPRARQVESGKGCYIHCVTQADVKLNAWLMRTAISTVAGTMVAWGETLRSFMKANHARITQIAQSKSYS